MANRWLYAGGDLGSVRAVGAIASTTTSSRFNSTYTDGAIAVTGTTYFYCDFIDASGASDAAVTGETLWYRATVQITATTVNNRIELVNGSDQPWLAVRVTGSNALGLFYNSGTGASPVWTQIGSSWVQAFGANTTFNIDIRLTLGSPHTAEVYADSVLKASGTFTQASLTSIDASRHCDSGTSTGYASEIMAVVGISTIGGHVATSRPTGAGNSSAWTGASTAIDEINVDDTDMISSGTAGQRSTFTYGDVPTLAPGYALGDVFLFTRAKNDGSSPTNVKPVRRTAAGVDSVGSNMSGMGLGFADFVTRYSGLSATEFNGSEFGVESAA